MFLLILGLFLQSSDFGGLTIYRSANAVLPILAPGEQRVVFFGDSITNLWNLSDSFPTKEYINRGISGQTSAQLLLRIRQDVIDIRATHVVLLCGINDIGGLQGLTTNQEVESNIAAMAELASQHGVTVILSTLLPVRGTRLTTHPMSRIIAINDWIRPYAAEHHYQLIDYFTLMVNGEGVLCEECTSDDLHPNSLAYGRMAVIAEHAIERSLGEG